MISGPPGIGKSKPPPSRRPLSLLLIFFEIPRPNFIWEHAIRFERETNWHFFFLFVWSLASSALVICRELNFEAIEFNASDTRNKTELEVYCSSPLCFWGIGSDVLSPFEEINLWNDFKLRHHSVLQNLFLCCCSIFNKAECILFPSSFPCILLASHILFVSSSTGEQDDTDHGRGRWNEFWW